MCVSRLLTHRVVCLDSTLSIIILFLLYRDSSVCVFLFSFPFYYWLGLGKPGEKEMAGEGLRGSILTVPEDVDGPIS